MQIKKNYSNATTVKLTVIPSADELKLIHRQVLEHLNTEHVKVPGFRPGKAPLNLIEKNANPSEIQSEFLDSAMNQLYVRAVEAEKLRPVDQPTVTIQKFVPFATLEFTAEVEVIGALELADYRHIKITKQALSVTAKDIDAVVASLQQRAAEKKEVERPAKIGDEVEIDFKGTDPKTDKPIQGADGKAYPLVLGSNTFIPGFEPRLLALRSKKSFPITFPKDYSVSALRSKKVNFAITVTAVRELTIPKLDDAFVARISPFKTIAELREDIKKAANC